MTDSNYPYQRIAVPKPLYERIVKLAEDNGRTISGQIAWMVKQNDIVHVDELPRPDEQAAHVPVVYIAKGEM